MASLEEVFEEFKVFLPKYLNPDQKNDLFEALSAYPNINHHYMAPASIREGIFQGDGWRGLVVINFINLERRNISGVILSNSCDVDVQNRRKPRNALFAPLISLRRYQEGMVRDGLSSEQVNTALREIRSQHISNVYHLPAKPYGPEESIILLDDIHAEPITYFLENDHSFLFRLTQPSFYILLIKLSIHFCRAQEGEIRLSPEAGLSPI